MQGRQNYNSYSNERNPQYDPEYDISYEQGQEQPYDPTYNQGYNQQYDQRYNEGYNKQYDQRYTHQYDQREVLKYNPSPDQIQDLRYNQRRDLRYNQRRDQRQDLRYNQRQNLKYYHRQEPMYNNVIYPTFADRTPRTSTNYLKQPPTAAEKVLSSIGLQQSATGKYKVPMREKHSFLGLLSSVVTFVVATPILLLYGAAKGISNAIKEDKYDDDAYFEERLYPKEIYEQKQNTRTEYYEDVTSQQPIYQNPTVPAKPKMSTKVFETSKALADQRKEEVRNMMYKEIKNSSKDAMKKYFTSDDFEGDNYIAYNMGDIIKPNVVYEFTTNSCVDIDLREMVVKEFSNFVFKEHVIGTTPVREFTFANEYVFAFDRTNYKYDILKKGTISDRFVSIVLDIQTYQSDKDVFISELEDKHMKLKASHVSIQSPPGIDVKVRFMIIE